MEEFSPPPPPPAPEIKAINAAQDVGSEVMGAERPELAARGASALVRTSNNTQLQARSSLQITQPAEPSTAARGQGFYQQPGMFVIFYFLMFIQVNIASCGMKFPDMQS